MADRIKIRKPYLFRGGSAGGNTDMLILLDSHVVVTPVTNVDFTGLTIAGLSRFLLVSNIDNDLGVSTAFNLFVNGDNVISNYACQHIEANGATVSGARLTGARLLALNPGRSGGNEAWFGIDPIGRFFMNADGGERNDTAGITLNRYYAGKTATIADITSIRIGADQANAIGAGSEFYLYGLKNA